MNQQIQIKTNDELKTFIYKNYMTQIKNFFGNEQQAMKFLSSVMSSVQRTPKLMECDTHSLINSFMTMAQLGLMPSDVSGEAYVLPYKGKAQFQLGYQGLITLFYRAGGQRITAEIVRKGDAFSYTNGKIEHSIDIMKSNKQRGEAVAAYAIATINGQEISKAMNKEDIMAIGQQFSKSFSSDYSPWNEKNDPELHMWKKTVIKQLSKYLPKTAQIHHALAEDNKESNIDDRRKKMAIEQSESLKMGSVLEDPKEPSKASELMKQGMKGSKQ